MHAWLGSGGNHGIIVSTCPGLLPNFYESDIDMSDNRIKYLFKNTAIFTIGNLATKLISFFLIPLYTQVLTTEEYGTIDLVVTICTIAVPILTLNVMESVMRFNLDNGVDKNEISKIGILILALGAMAGLILIPICSLFGRIRDLGWIIYLYVICSAASQILLADLRGKELLVQYSFGNVLNTLLIAVLNIVFLVTFQWGITGYLLAYSLANLCVAIYALVTGKGYLSVFSSFDKNKMKEMLKYSIVLIPNSFMWWIMNSSDHVMVTSMIGASANGIYAISYKLPTLISTFMGIFTQAWSYSAIKEKGAEDEESYNNKVFRMLISMVMMAGVCMMAIIKPFLHVYVQKKFSSAWEYTPFLIIGSVFLTLASFMSTSYTVHKDSKGYLCSGTLGAVMNIVLNLMLIPTIGVYGAAFATCISYIAVFAFRVIHTRKYIHYHVFTKELMIGTAALVVSGIFMFVNSGLAVVGQLGIVLTVIVCFRKDWMPISQLLRRRLQK